jgi:serine/threonine protein kinase
VAAWPACRSAGGGIAADLEQASPSTAAQATDERHWGFCRHLALQVIAPLLRVLSVLHGEHSVVHRDIKPENIFLTAGGAS